MRARLFRTGSVPITLTLLAVLAAGCSRVSETAEDLSRYFSCPACYHARRTLSEKRD